jgi:hypothetical protein
MQKVFPIDSQRLARKKHNDANDRCTFEKVALPGSVNLYGSGLETTAYKTQFRPLVARVTSYRTRYRAASQLLD